MCLITNKRQTVIEDPTRQAGNRRRAIASIRKRLKGAQQDIFELIDTIPVLEKNMAVNKAQYVWEMSPERINQVDALIFQIVNGWFDTNSNSMPNRWFFFPYSQIATQQAAADALGNIKNLSKGIVSIDQLDAETVQNIFNDPQYKSVITNIYGRAFNEMKGFAGETAADLARVLADSIFLGQSARQARNVIRQRFGVADSRAERIARTEINRAYTQSRTEAAQVESRRLGLDVRVLHRSSLMASTRRWHAERHGKVYTIQQQNDWWAEGANRINCLCSISEIVVNEKGEMRSKGLEKKMKAQRELWLKTSGVKPR